MVRLRHSEIFRSGKTAPRHNFETRECRVSMGSDSKTLNVSFELASKGGGITEVLLKIGFDDIPAILKEIVQTL